MAKILFAVLLFFTASLTILYGQEGKIKFSDVLSERGEKIPTVHSIVKDNSGFMWFGTVDGLVRFDGYDFKTYKNIIGNSQSLSDNFIFDIFVDSKNNLWISTQNGLDYFDRRSENFTVYKNNPSDKNSLSNNMVLEVFEDSKGVIWVSTFSCIDRFDKASNKFFAYRNSKTDTNSIITEKVYNIIQDNEGDIWFAGNYGISRYNRVTDNFINYSVRLPDNKGFTSTDATSIFNDSYGNIWVGTNSGNSLFLYNKKKDIFEKIEINISPTNIIHENFILSFREDKDKNLWFAFNNYGLVKLNLKNFYNTKIPDFIWYKNNPQDPNSIPGNISTAIYADDENILWVASVYGFKKAYLEQKKFHSISSTYDLKLPKAAMTGIIDDNVGNLYFATYGEGLIKYDKSTGKYFSYKQSAIYKNSIKSPFLGSMSKDKYGNLWIGSYGGGLTRFNPLNNTFKSFTFNKNNPKNISHNVVFCTLPDNDYLWIGTQKGLDKFNLKTEEVEERFSNIPNDPSSLSDNLIAFIYKDISGRLWIATLNGLDLFDPTAKIFTVFKPDSLNKYSISNPEIFHIAQSRDGVLWISTYGGGLNKLEFDKNNKPVFTAYTEKDGLKSNNLYTVIVDDIGYIWIASDKGLSRLNPKTNVIKTFTSTDGLAGDDFNQLSFLKTNDGTLYFGGPVGMTYFKPQEIIDNHDPPKLVFTNFSVFNNEIKPNDKTGYLKETISETNGITIPYSASVISFTFAGLQYVNPLENQYAYKLEGFDNDWVYSNQRRFVTYTNLPTGDYTLRIKASNFDGFWNDTGKSLKITIVPPYYMTWWFRGFIIMILITAGPSIYFFRVNILKRQKENLEKTVLERTKEIQEAKEKTELALIETENAKKDAEKANQLKTELLGIAAHDLKNPLTSIIGFSDILKERLDTNSEPYEFAEYINNSSKNMQELVMELLDRNAIESGKIDLKLTELNLSKLSKLIIDEYEYTATRKNQKINFQIEPNCYVYADVGRLKEVMVNLVSNAIKYSPYQKSINISLSKINNKVIFSVKDEGPGLTEKDKSKIFGRFQKLSARPTGGESSTGLGLSIAKQLIELMNGETGVESELGNGAKFFFELPAIELNNTKVESISKLIIPADDNTTFSGQRVLLVDDIQSIRETVKKMLTSKKVEIFEAENGKQGIEITEAKRPDLILMDISMPVMDGIEAVILIKSNPLFSKIPVIVITAEDTESLNYLPFDGHLKKPIVFPELIAILKKYLET